MSTTKGVQGVINSLDRLNATMRRIACILEKQGENNGDKPEEKQSWL